MRPRHTLLVHECDEIIYHGGIIKRRSVWGPAVIALIDRVRLKKYAENAAGEGMPIASGAEQSVEYNQWWSGAVAFIV